ncbi:DUF4097 family beta strand repeat-containing protein [Mycobacterium sp. NPDC050041]|uniref:DUF4097 family beta strand repeat-containing protein n=1 Tax=Mycobacterium sp. NPDC050041 TaxID=3364293 RepID=UPI003C2FCF17
MPTFPTPEPIVADIEVVAGSVRLTAGDRDDTVVDIRPRDPSRASDIRAAENARVDFANGRLKIAAGPKMLALGGRGAVDVDIALPSRSRLQASTASADVYADGLLGDCRFSSASGRVALDVVEGNLKADTASGDVAVRSVAGPVSISTASGDAVVELLHGELNFQAASGGLTVGELHGNARAQTASGPTTVTTAVTGSLRARTGSGDVEIGLPHGTAARLDVSTASGTVRNTLQPSDGPSDGDRTLEVHARTGSGDILVRRFDGAVR